MNDKVRIGDAEREAAAHELGENFAMGRITAEEHAERLEQIWAARTQAELAPVFGDLPRPRQPESRPSVKSRAQSRVPRAPHLPFLFKVLVAIVAVYFLFSFFFSHLPLLVIALLVYVLAVRRVAHRGRWHDHHARWR